MGSGVAKAIRAKWPEVYYEYRSKYDKAVDAAVNNKCENATAADYLLGSTQCVELYSQRNSKTK